MTKSPFMVWHHTMVGSVFGTTGGGRNDVLNVLLSFDETEMQWNLIVMAESQLLSTRSSRSGYSWILLWIIFVAN